MDVLVAFGAAVAEPADLLSSHQYTWGETKIGPRRLFSSRYWKLANVVVEARMRLVCRCRKRKKQKFSNAVQFL
jgi:hypothetical protein